MDGGMMEEHNELVLQDMVLVEVVVPVKQVVPAPLHMQDMVVMGFKFLLLLEIRHLNPDQEPDHKLVED
tara:strand:+ start:298 stop:504 length:207 start_codon:yes stop_codon:yes gene_type:complete